VNSNEDKPMFCVAICSPKTVVSGSVRFMQIFAGLPWKGSVV